MTSVVLVTGAHGFIGDRILRRLAERGKRVRALVRRDERVPGAAETIVGDVTDPVAVRRATAGAEVVVHTVANFDDDFSEALRVNVDATRALAEAARVAGCRRFVHLSTCGAYDLVGRDEVDESTPLWPLDTSSRLVYGVTKAEGERALAEVAGRGLSVVILRPPNVLGADERNPFAFRLPRLLAAGELAIPGVADNTWPYVHVDNLVDAVELALEAPIPSGTATAFSIVDGSVTWGEYVRTIAGWIGAEPAQRDPRPPYDDFRGRFATERAREVLGYRPVKTYADAMEETRALLVERGVIAS